MPNIEDALLIAARLADRERIVEDLGANRDSGGWIAKFLKAAGAPPGLPWCAAFVTYCLLEAGWQREQLPKYPASTWWWWHWAKDRNLLRWVWRDAKRGDLFVWNNGKVGHIGWIVECRKAGPWYWVRTIEGNSNDDGGREGTRIVRRGLQGASGIAGWRRVTSTMRYIDGKGMESLK